MSVSRTATRVLAVSALVTGTALSSTLLRTADAATAPEATSAATWLADELAASDHLLTQTFGDDVFPDYGVTLDAVMALTLADAEATEAAAALGVVEDELTSYIGFGEERYAGATAKTLLAVALTDGNVHAFGGVDLEAELRGLMATTGDDAGRFVDQSEFGDFSNGFGQGLAIMGLSHTTGGVPLPAVDFLLDQQCPGGGFRGLYFSPPSEFGPGVPTHTCTSDDEVDFDYTAIALDALLTAPTAPGVGAAVNDAVDWMLAAQEDDGSFINQDGAPNTNSAGFGAQALRAAGEEDAADDAADFVEAQQISAAEAGVGPAAGDVGAIAFSAAAHTEAIADGIGATSLDQFHRATAQAMLAFDLGPYGVVPAPTAATSDGEVQAGDSVTVSGTGFRAGETVSFTLRSDPVVVGTATASGVGSAQLTFTVPVVDAGAHSVQLAGGRSGFLASVPIQVLPTATTSSTTSSTVAGATTSSTAATAATSSSTTATGGALPKTGGFDVRDLLFAAMALLAAGALARREVRAEARFRSDRT